MTHSDIVISGRVRLARNYHDLPFSNLNHPQSAQLCVERAGSALPVGDGENCYAVYRLCDMPVVDQMALVEQHMISRDLLKNSSIGAALIRSDRAVSVMVNEEDHLRIQGMQSGLELNRAAELVFETEEKLESACAFSFDPQLGYLTACPTNTGTGIRASLMLHLPLLTHCKQMGNVTQSVAKLGLTIRGIYGEGSEALGDLYQVSNQVTLGRTENEIIEAVTVVGKQLIEMEENLRARALKESYELEDRIFRSYGILRYARQMDGEELMEHWSQLRLGASLRFLPVDLCVTDELLTLAQDAHAKQYKAAHAAKLTTDQARCEIIRDKLRSKKQEES